MLAVLPFESLSRDPEQEFERRGRRRGPEQYLYERRRRHRATVPAKQYIALYEEMHGPQRLAKRTKK